MNKLSMLDEKIQGKDESWYINQCSGQNKIDDKSTPYGSIKTYAVGNEKVVLSFNCYSNGDDFDEELVDVKILPCPMPY